MTMYTQIRNWYYQHRIETFGCVLFVCLLFLVIDIRFIQSTKSKSDIVYENSNSIYVRNFKSSLSQQEGQIAQIYRSSDGKKIAIMLKFDNISKIVSDASEYQIYYKGFDITEGKYAKKTLSHPSGGYVVFKQSGISMIYLYSEDGFKSQATEIVVRCNNTLSTVGEDSKDTSELAKVDASYAEHDQFRIIVNPAGSDVVVSEALDAPNFDAESLYRDAFISADEKKIRATLNDDINEMYRQLSRIVEYRQGLEEMRVMVPEYDPYIGGDTFTPAEGIADVDYIYQPQNIMEGGIAYAWWVCTLKTGSFLDYKPDSMASYDDATFLNKLGVVKQYSMPLTEDFNNRSVRLADGEVIQLNDKSEIQNIQVISRLVKDYIAACNGYLTAKQRYLCTDMKSYCVLEYNMKTTGNDYSINMNPNTITVW